MGVPWTRQRQGLEGVTALEGAGSPRLIGWDDRNSSATSAAMDNTFRTEQDWRKYGWPGVF
jgi:hypothetical protein